MIGYFLVQWMDAAIHPPPMAPSKTALTYAIEADLPTDVKMEIVGLLKNHPERLREKN
jgi:hypothetical protein